MKDRLLSGDNELRPPESNKTMGRSLLSVPLVQVLFFIWVISICAAALYGAGIIQMFWGLLF